MKSKVFLLAIIVITVVIGVSLVSCKEEIPGLNKGNPPSALLSKAGITQSTINKLNNAAKARAVKYGGTEYEGYVHISNANAKMLILYYRNKTKNTFKSIVEQLEKDPEVMFMSSYAAIYGGTGDAETDFGFYDDGICAVVLAKDEYKGGMGGEVPRGFLAVFFMYDLAY